MTKKGTLGIGGILLMGAGAWLLLRPQEEEFAGFGGGLSPAGAEIFGDRGSTVGASSEGGLLGGLPSFNFGFPEFSQVSEPRGSLGGDTKKSSTGGFTPANFDGGSGLEFVNPQAVSSSANANFSSITGAEVFVPPPAPVKKSSSGGGSSRSSRNSGRTFTPVRNSTQTSASLIKQAGGSTLKKASQRKESEKRAEKLLDRIRRK